MCSCLCSFAFLCARNSLAFLCNLLSFWLNEIGTIMVKIIIINLRWQSHCHSWSLNNCVQESSHPCQTVQFYFDCESWNYFYILFIIHLAGYLLQQHGLYNNKTIGSHFHLIPIVEFLVCKIFLNKRVII